MPEQQPKIDKEPVKKEGFSVETKGIISSSLIASKEGLERDAAEKFKGKEFEGKEGEERKRKLQVLETASKIDNIDKLSPQAKKLILGELNFENKCLNSLWEGEKDPVKKEQLKSEKIDPLTEARKELAGNITGGDPKKTEEEADKKAASERKTLEEEIIRNKKKINDLAGKFKGLAERSGRPGWTGTDQVELTKMQRELEGLRKDEETKEAVLKNTNASTVLEGKFQEIGVMSEKELKNAEDEILKSKKGPERIIVAPEGKEKKLQPLKVEQETPWAAFRRDKEFLGKWARITEVNSKDKTTIDGIIVKEIEETKFNFASEYAKKHKQEIKDAKGVDYEKVDKMQLIGIVDEMGGFEELTKNSEYAKYNEKIDDLAITSAGWTAEGVRHNVAVGTLNLFQKRKERLSQQLEKRNGELTKVRREILEVRKTPALEKMYDEMTKDVKGLKADLNELSKEMKIVTEATIGKDLTKEAYNANMENVTNVANNLKSDSGRESYIKQLGWHSEVVPAKNVTIFGKIKGGITGEAPKTREKITKLTDENGEPVGNFTDEALRNLLVENFRDKTTNEFIGKEVEGIATSPEKARQGIKELYGRMRKDVMEDFINDKLKKEIKDPKALEKIKEIAKGKGIDAAKALEITRGGTEAYKDRTGDYKTDADKIINDTKSTWGVDISREGLDKFAKENPYGSVAGKDVSFFIWLIKAMFETVISAEKK